MPQLADGRSLGGALAEVRPSLVAFLISFVVAGMYWVAHRDLFSLIRRTDRQRGFGDFYGFVLVAQGSGELMVEHGVHVWDVAAIQPIVEEAGGRFTDWDGNATIQRPDVLATNGKLHDDVLNLLRGERKA